MFYLSNILPIAFLMIDFIFNGLKINYKIIIVNLVLLVLYLIITALGEVAMGDPIYGKVEGSETYILNWKGFSYGP